VFAVLTLVACGDNLPAVGPPLERADTMFIIAHFDDDMIFMQPELLHAIEAGSLTTVYVTSGDLIHGNKRAEHTFEAARVAYAAAAGASDWDCGYLRVGESPVHHCRLPDAQISLIGLDIPDGGTQGDEVSSLLHLVDRTVSSLPIMGAVGGRATAATITETLAALITATAPDEIHALDLAACHGRDHSSHLLSSSFALWAAAQAGYPGAMRFHRGYNVDAEPVTLSQDDYDLVVPMLAHFEACYYGCAPCGSPCTELNEAHETWMHRQYSSDRSPLDAHGALALDEAAGLCAQARETGLVLGDCAGAPPVRIDATGHLQVGGACIASVAGLAEPVALVPCADDPAQYWVSDSEGHLWNGRPPDPSADMAFDHVRCLDVVDGGAAAPPGTTLVAPTCGEHRRSRWHIEVPAAPRRVTTDVRAASNRPLVP
jgi:hypothetical protein